MSIGSTIRFLRREKDITQEQLAEYLGITSRAVSQWECDRTAPDLSQLPALCHIFDVSADVLLGIETERREEAIQGYLDRAREKEHAGDFENSVEILREGLRQYPRSYAMMNRLANAIVCVYSRKGIKEYEEVFELCNRVLAECTDNMTRYEAIDTLGTAYGYAGKKEEMLKLAEEMPKAQFSYENFMLYRWEGDADFEKKQSYISYLIYELISVIGLSSGHRHNDNTFIYSKEDRIKMHQLQVDLLERLFPDGDYQYKAQIGEIACSNMVTIYLRSQDLENVWKWLEKGADFAIHMDTYDFDAPHTSPILRGYSDGGWIMEADGNRSQSMLEWITNDEAAAVLRADPRFEMLTKRLQQVARKP